MANCAHGLGGAVPFFAALAFAQRAWTALRALALRCSGRLVGDPLLAADLPTLPAHLHEIFSNRFWLRCIEKLSNLCRYLFCHGLLYETPVPQSKLWHLTYETPVWYNQI